MKKDTADIVLGVIGIVGGAFLLKLGWDIGGKNKPLLFIAISSLGGVCGGYLVHRKNTAMQSVSDVVD